MKGLTRNKFKRNMTSCELYQDDLHIDMLEKELYPLTVLGSVGGIRASLYNAITVEEAEALVEYMKSFHQEHCNKD